MDVYFEEFVGRECPVDVTEYHFLVGRLLGDELPVVVYGEVHLLRGEAQPLPDLAPQRLGHPRPHQRRQLPRPRTSGRPGVQNLRPAGKLQLRTLLNTLTISNAAVIEHNFTLLTPPDPERMGSSLSVSSSASASSARDCASSAVSPDMPASPRQLEVRVASCEVSEEMRP